jgi:hypothetical protein
MDRPSIKGTAFESVAADLTALVESGRIARRQLEERLAQQDLAALEEKILPSAWYPVDTYGRLLQLLGDVEGEGHAGYFVERGARAAERLIGLGIYHQAERAERLRQREGEDWLEPGVSLMLTMGGVLFNFMRWSYQPSPGGRVEFGIGLSEAAELPECGRYTVQGFIEFTARKLVGDPELEVTSLRPSQDQIVYRCRASD